MKFNGKEYRLLVNTTFEHDFRIKQFLVNNDLYIIDAPSVGDDFDADLFAMQLIEKLVVGNVGVKLLSLLLVPDEIEDVDWTVAVGDEIYVNLLKCTDRTEKEQIQQLMLSALTGFFAAGLMSLKISR